MDSVWRGVAKRPPLLRLHVNKLRPLAMVKCVTSGTFTVLCTPSLITPKEVSSLPQALTAQPPLASTSLLCLRTRLCEALCRPRAYSTPSFASGSLYLMDFLNPCISLNYLNTYLFRNVSFTGCLIPQMPVTARSQNSTCR